MLFLRNLAKKLAVIISFLLICGVFVNCSATVPIGSGNSCSLPLHSTKTPIYVKAILHLDPAFTADEQSAIANSALMWSNATGGQAEFQIALHALADKDLLWDENSGCSPHVVIMRLLSTDKIITDLEEQIKEESDPSEGEFHLLGFTNKKCKLSLILLVADRLPEGDLQQVMAHELGHYLGVPHIKVPKFSEQHALMHPFRDSKHSSPCLTTLDLKKFCDVQGCEPEHLRACE